MPHKRTSRKRQITEVSTEETQTDSPEKPIIKNKNNTRNNDQPATRDLLGDTQSYNYIEISDEFIESLNLNQPVDSGHEVDYDELLEFINEISKSSKSRERAISRN